MDKGILGTLGYIYISIFVVVVVVVDGAAAVVATTAELRATTVAANERGVFYVSTLINYCCGEWPF